jgi:hypothetical protein
MSTITRGYNFNPIEQVNASKLAMLVANADISGISWSEFQGQAVGISIFSAPAGAPTGWIHCAYEPLPSAAQSNYAATHAEFNYYIQSPNGPVLLFGQTRMETRRFVGTFGSNGTQPLGNAAFVGTPSNSVTLTLGFETGNAGYGNPHCFGLLQATATTSPTNSDGFPRIIIKGFAYFNNSAGDTAVVAIPHYLFSAAAGDGSINYSGNTSMDKCFGLSIAGEAGVSIKPAYLWGAPLWRA